MSRTPVHTDQAPAAIGPYSQAIRHNDTLYVSGQIPLDPANGELVNGIDAQIVRVFDNLKAVVEAGGGSLDNALKVTVFLTDLGNFTRVNDVMAQYFNEPFPARAAVQVSALPRGADVEADAVVAL